MNTQPFIKMHGLGNDFVILDHRLDQPEAPQMLSAENVRAIANRRTGVGCDQLIVLEPATDSDADVFMRIYNPDGSQAGACGNATRCVASLLMIDSNDTQTTIQTIAGLLDCENLGDGLYRVDMGPARLDWRDIPLSQASDTAQLGLSQGPLSGGVAVNMGNPHVVFVVDDVETLDLAAHGPIIEHSDLFPERTNVEAVQILDDDRIRMRVWERGAGITQACGSGACAALVATALKGLTNRKAEVILDGGSLTIEWLADGNVLMSGPVATSYTGELDPSLFTPGTQGTT